jgi:hypothetical protein
MASLHCRRYAHEYRNSHEKIEDGPQGDRPVFGKEDKAE